MSGSEIICGDCRKVMAGRPAESVDAVVCDPPYGLEFMGKEWDKLGATVAPFSESQVNGATDYHGKGNAPFGGGGKRVRYGKSARSMQDWHYRWAVEALRVAKPGAFLLAFGGTRTYHRLVCAIEDAGWEVRDTICWLYGCLSEDTEILVDGKWEPYEQAVAGRLALCYDVVRNEYTWQPIQDLYVYDYDDTAYRILSDRTDQIVSRNHRCLVERGGEMVFELAEEAARKRQASVPVLENVQDLLKHFPLPYKRAGSAEQVLFAGLHPEGRGKKEALEGTQRQDSQVCGLPNGDMEARCVVAESRKANVLQGVQRCFAGAGMGETRPQGAFGVDAGIQGVVYSQDERREQSFMEGWGDLLPQARQLQADQIRQVPGRASGDGSEGRLCDGASSFCCSSNSAMSTPLGSGPSQGSQPPEQQSGQSATIRQQSGPQAVRGQRFTTTTVASVRPIHYRGVVWCVRVPTGAFVARRNGKVFVTGNSGFPKSLDVGKAIDKLKGAEREVVGSGTSGVSRGVLNAANYPDTFGGKYNVTAPATPEAEQWDGWGTALKPSHEPVVVARKPLEGTVAQNVLKWGVGGINVDGCRVGTEIRTNRAAGNKPNGNSLNLSKVGMPQDAESTVCQGRWPANVVHDGSEEVLRGFPESSVTGKRTSKSQRATVQGTNWLTDNHESQEYVDSGSAARFFYCAKASRKERTCGGKVVNNHATVKPLALMRWLVRLVTPPDGVVLDPFCGSGTTLLAAREEGFHYIGIDNNEDYVAIARQRLEATELALFK